MILLKARLKFYLVDEAMDGNGIIFLTLNRRLLKTRAQNITANRVKESSSD
ncbi:hypothetical protein PGT21_015532 [Puccinia graminis f. sp. tritici]|uniref:Uncharacterized protein n=1 Tax=Puccinia graminis f. sp. tritici TaxID=56615 RepID=A0A5B0S201_PUCGR|nr:hypothetical protein PGT21_015532 [Puccinia graminis f. sp. tritici]KAA1132030.1 hypothetical protein PGTUg99_036169 [Puccinia graminis f. sp. tritici]